jgi:hypothetical protein
MGNIFNSFKKSKNNQLIFNRTLFEPLNGDPYASLNLYNNLDFIEINEKIEEIKKRLAIFETNLNIIEENTQENIQLLSKDIYHINSKLDIKPPVII